jgi:hypothetical protein
MAARVTGAGLAHLKGPTDFKRLFFSNTRLTDAGPQELDQALPGPEIIC